MQNLHEGPATASVRVELSAISSDSLDGLSHHFFDNVLHSNEALQGMKVRNWSKMRGPALYMSTVGSSLPGDVSVHTSGTLGDAPTTALESL